MIAAGQSDDKKPLRNCALLLRRHAHDDAAAVLRTAVAVHLCPVTVVAEAALNVDAMRGLLNALLLKILPYNRDSQI